MPCSPNMLTVRACSKLKLSWKSVVLQIKSGRILDSIPLTLVGHEMIMAYAPRWLATISYPTRTCGIIVNYLYWLLNFATLPLWNNFAKGFIIPRGLHVVSETSAKRKQAISSFAPIISRNNKLNRKKTVTHLATHIPPKIFGGRPSLHNRPASESRGGWALGLKE